MRGKKYSEKKRIREQIREMEESLDNSASSLLYYEFARYPIPPSM
jgi:hypothetical protein